MSGPRKSGYRLKAIAESARYVWAHQYGRLAVLTILVGVIGLITHLWLPVILAGAIRTRRPAHLNP